MLVLTFALLFGPAIALAPDDIVPSTRPGKPSAPAQWPGLFTSEVSSLPAPLRAVLLHNRGKGLRARFTEEKRVAVLKRPLTSSGTLTFLPGEGLYRHMQAPFSQELYITAAAVHQRDDRGEVSALDLSSQPAGRAFVQAFFAVFSGSWQVLHEHFEIYFSRREGAWTLGLVPRNPAMKKLVARMVLTGRGEAITTMWVEETSGDLTITQFSRVELLDPAEHARAFHERIRWIRR